MVYRVVLATDDEPQARLAIGPRIDGDAVLFFDTMRQRSIIGQITGHPQGDPEAIRFTQDDGLELVFEPLTLERYQEIAHGIEGQPSFPSTDDLQDFFLDMAGL